MTEFRDLKVCAEDIDAMEKAGEELMRSHKPREGLAVLTTALRLRQAWRMTEVFACDVDESGGQLIDLHDFSRRV